MNSEVWIDTFRLIIITNMNRSCIILGVARRSTVEEVLRVMVSAGFYQVSTTAKLLHKPEVIQNNPEIQSTA